jgi:steroid 5-alpha reductase family enzyme
VEMGAVGFELMFVGWAGVAVLMVLLWIYSEAYKNAGIVDVGWAASTGALGVYYAFAASGLPARRLGLGLLTGIWGFRLAWYLFFDRVYLRPEDKRYNVYRVRWEPNPSGKFFLVFQAQGLLVVVLSLPFLLACSALAPVGPTDVAALFVWVVGICGEAMADHQLVRFKADPANRGKTCRAGLWRYSRHPNYFFEWTIWCAYAMVAWPHTYGILAWISPAIMLFLLLKVTGIPPAEAQSLKSRGDEYREYQRTTSAFIPWRVRR